MSFLSKNSMHVTFLKTYLDLGCLHSIDCCLVSKIHKQFTSTCHIFLSYQIRKSNAHLIRPGRSFKSICKVYENPVCGQIKHRCIVIVILLFSQASHQLNGPDHILLTTCGRHCIYPSLRLWTIQFIFSQIYSLNRSSYPSTSVCRWMAIGTDQSSGQNWHRVQNGIILLNNA